MPLLYGVTLRKLRLEASAILAALWRPVVGAALMALVVAWTEERLWMGQGTDFAALELLLAIGVGVATYALSVLFMWNLARRPGGAERFILDKMVALTRRIRRPA
jgi:uncharacterized membrane protein